MPFEALKQVIEKRALELRQRNEAEEDAALAARGAPPKRRGKRKGYDYAKAAQNILDGIEARRKVALDRFIFALGIPEIGETTAKALSRRFGDVPELMKAARAAAGEQPGEAWSAFLAIPRIGEGTMERLAKATLDELADPAFDPTRADHLGLNSAQLVSLRERYPEPHDLRRALAEALGARPGPAYAELAALADVGPVAAQSLGQFFTETHNRDAVEALLAAGVETEAAARPEDGGLPGGRQDGGLHRIAGEDDARGGQGDGRRARRQGRGLGVQEDRSRGRRTGAGSKLDKAREHGVAIVSEDEWLDMIGAA